MKKTLSAIFAATMIPLGANAATLLTQIFEPNRSDFVGTVGIVFEVATDIIVTDLGFQDADSDGLAVSHQVGLWENDGAAQSLLASTTIQAGTASTLDADYRYESVAPITLTAGTRYFLGASVDGNDAWSDGGFSAAFEIASESLNEESAFTTTPFGNATGLGGGDTLRWGPANLQFTVVPEPSSTLLLGVAGAGLLIRRRRS